MHITWPFIDIFHQSSRQQKKSILFSDELVWCIDNSNIFSVRMLRFQFFSLLTRALEYINKTENFVIVPADKASNNLTFVCKRHYVDILIEELGLHSLTGNPTYNLTDFSASEVLDNHKSVLTSFWIQTNNKELDLPYNSWIKKMHKKPYKHRFIAGSSKCSTKPLSILLTKLLTHIKQGHPKYCETAYPRSGVNQMWILKNSKDLLDHLKSPNFNLITNIKLLWFFDPLHNHSSPET